MELEDKIKAQEKAIAEMKQRLTEVFFYLQEKSDLQKQPQESTDKSHNSFCAEESACSLPEHSSSSRSRSFLEGVSKKLGWKQDIGKTSNSEESQISICVSAASDGQAHVDWSSVIGISDLSPHWQALLDTRCVIV